MKRIFIAILAMVGAFGLCSAAQGEITNSAHDFSNSGWNTTGQICIVCHAPHNGLDVEDAPLWNHTVTEATYTLYSSPTLTATDLGQPVGVSKLCLSCHDGTVAVDAFGGRPGTHTIGAAYDLGTDLSNDHPISFTYDTALATEDGGLADPMTAPSGVDGGTGTIDADMLYAGRVECSSCHDVHNKYGEESLLLVYNGGSALCLTCHTK